MDLVELITLRQELHEDRILELAALVQSLGCALGGNCERFPPAGGWLRLYPASVLRMDKMLLALKNNLLAATARTCISRHQSVNGALALRSVGDE